MNPDKAFVIVGCCISICIVLIFISYNLTQITCVDEKVKISEQLVTIDKLQKARKYIEAGVCYDFPESDQIVCRNSLYDKTGPGKITVHDSNRDGVVTSSVQSK